MALYTRVSAIALLVAATVACANTRLKSMGTVPGTFAPQGDEARLWDDARALQRRIDQDSSVYRDSVLEAYVTAVARRVAGASLDTSTFSPRVRILSNPLLNAFALPHGTIYVHTGILARMDNEAQLATVLGHELAHVTHRHSIRELRAARNKRTVAQVFSGVTTVAGAVALGAGAATVISSLTGPLGNLWLMTAVNGYSRELESQADTVGLQSMTRAGYDPCEAPKVFEHLQRTYDAGRVPETFYYGTHPRLLVRQGNYLNMLGRQCIGAAADSTPRSRDNYQERMSVLVLDNAFLDFEIDRIATAEAGLKRHLATRPTSPRGHFLRGEIARWRGRTDTAIAAYKEAVRLDTTYADPHRELGFLYRELGRRQEARAALRRYMELSPAALDAPIVEDQLIKLENP